MTIDHHRPLVLPGHPDRFDHQQSVDVVVKTHQSQETSPPCSNISFGYLAHTDLDGEMELNGIWRRHWLFDTRDQPTSIFFVLSSRKVPAMKFIPYTWARGYSNISKPLKLHTSMTRETSQFPHNLLQQQRNQHHSEYHLVRSMIYNALPASSSIHRRSCILLRPSAFYFVCF